jgi:hypothetical protein
MKTTPPPLARVAFAAGLIFIVIVVFWSSPTPPSAIRLTFLYSTNHPQFGKVGVFELANQLNETISSSGGHYKPAKRSGLNAEKGDWGAMILGVHQFAAATTNMLQVWSPTNGGQYKLVLQCLPASKSTPQFYGSARFRIASFLSPWVHPSFATQARWYGSLFAESQSFETKP